MPANFIQRLTGSRLGRRAADAFLVRYAHARTRKLDRRDLALTQERTLFRLIERARTTRFGRDHQFDSIRSVADYQARVPLRDYETLWSQYWEANFPRLKGTTWPDDAPYYALSSGTTTGATKYIPVTHEMVKSNRKAALTTMALFRHHRPEAKIFTGKLFFLGGSTDLRDLGNGSLAGDLSGIASREVWSGLRPYTFPPLEIALMRDWDQKVARLAEQGAREPITAISGIPAWLMVLFGRLKAITGKSTVAEIWPDLRLIIHGGTNFEPFAELFWQEVGSDAVTYSDTYPCSEGYVATTDPRYGMLRLLPDHGIFFEFIPVEELDDERPTRHTAAQVQTDVQYAVVMTTCAGLWSYVVGDTVRFECTDPPLLKFTGRTKFFLSAFGEHLIAEEVTKAITEAAVAFGCHTEGHHVGPVFPSDPNKPGWHRYFIEFAHGKVPDLNAYAAKLDEILCRLNEDYEAHRIGDLSMLRPEVVAVPPGGFAEWMRHRGKFGGQNKIPEMDNTGNLTRDLENWLASESAGQGGK